LATDIALQRLVPFLVVGAAVMVFGSLAQAMGWLVALPLLSALAAALGPLAVNVPLPWVLLGLSGSAVVALAVTYQQGRRLLGGTILATVIVGSVYLPVSYLLSETYPGITEVDDGKWRTWPLVVGVTA